MEIVRNIEKNGIELYFNSKPEQKIIDMLKANKFRWHNIKKCWYAKENPTILEVVKNIQQGKIEIVTKENTSINEYGVKVGDIFYMSWGYEQTNLDFFRVEKLRGKTQVVIREVRLKVKEEVGISSMSSNRIYDINNYKYVENSVFIKDNEKGEIKRISGNKDKPYISMDCGIANKYDGDKALYESWYN